MADKFKIRLINNTIQEFVEYDCEPQDFSTWLGLEIDQLNYLFANSPHTKLEEKRDLEISFKMASAYTCEMYKGDTVVAARYQ